MLAATDAEMTALTTEANVGKVVKFTGTTGTYQQQRLYLIKSNATIIEFTIGGTSYQAEEGMTWAEWIESEYNTDNLVLGYGDEVVYNTTNGYSVFYNGEVQTSYETVYEYEYTYGSYSGGGSGN